jgi:hypothetical protein
MHEALLGVDLAGVRDGGARCPHFAATLRSTTARRRGVVIDNTHAATALAISGAMMFLPRTWITRIVRIEKIIRVIRIEGFDQGYRLHVEDIALNGAGARKPPRLSR